MQCAWQPCLLAARMFAVRWAFGLPVPSGGASRSEEERGSPDQIVGLRARSGLSPRASGSTCAMSIGFLSEGRAECCDVIIFAGKVYNERRNPGIAYCAIVSDKQGLSFSGTFQAVINFIINTLVN
jgi:hypothetical protein